MEEKMLQKVLYPLAGLVLTTSMAYAGCSNQTIRGDYTFEVHGQALSADGSTVVGLIDGVGVIAFDGVGNLNQEDYVVRNGSEAPGGPSGFNMGEAGTYSINEDCTGEASITLSSGNTRSEVLVVTQTGVIHGVVTSAMVNGSPAVLQVSSSFQKIERR
jgi:hypothetical protein